MVDNVNVGVSVASAFHPRDLENARWRHVCSDEVAHSGFGSGQRSIPSAVTSLHSNLIYMIYSANVEQNSLSHQDEPITAGCKRM